MKQSTKSDRLSPSGGGGTTPAWRIEPDVIVSKSRLSIDDDYGSETFIRTIDCETLLGLRNAVRELNCGTIPIYSDYDCTGLVCSQWCKFIKIYKTVAGYCALVEITVSRDV